MKDFFENPEVLFGVPLVLIGVLGLLLAISALSLPERATATAEGPTRRGHPDEAEYVKIGIILAVITVVEVALFYIEMDRAILIPTLIALSAAKFGLVVAWFMHLRFDSALFTTAFVTGMVLAVAAFAVVLATLGGSLI